MTKPIPDRYCGACTKLLVRGPNEPLGNFRRRKYCDRACMAAGFRAAPAGEDAEILRHERVARSLTIEIRDQRLRNGRLNISAHTTDPVLRNSREASLRKLMERGDVDVVELVRARKIHITDVDAAVREGDYQRLKIRAGKPCDTIGVAVQRVLRSVKATKELGTFKAYDTFGRSLEWKFGKRTPLDDVSAEDATAFIHGLQQKGAAWSAGVQRQAVQFYRRVWKAGHARTQPWATIELPRKRKVRVTFLKPAEWQALSARHAGLPVHAILALGTLAGLRLGEIINLRTDIDIDLPQRLIRVQPRKGEHAWRPKSDNGVRDVPICDELFAVLVAHVNDGFAGARFFIRVAGRDERVSKGYAARQVQNACIAVGIKWGMKGDGITTHSLRHTFASWLAQNDVQMQKIAVMLGDDVAMVARYYAHLCPSDLTRAVKVIDAMARAA